MSFPFFLMQFSFKTCHWIPLCIITKSSLNCGMSNSKEAKVRKPFPFCALYRCVTGFVYVLQLLSELG